MPIVGLITLRHVLLATDIFRDLHVVDDVAGSGNKKCGIVQILERPGVVQHLLELLHKHEVLISRFRTVVLLVTENYNLIRKKVATFLTHNDGFSNPKVHQNMKTINVRKHLETF